MRKLKVTEMQRMNVDDFHSASKFPLVVVLDHVRSLYNVGSMFRTADAFRLSGLCLCGITATPPHVEIHKTALGAEESVDWKYFERTEDAVEWLHEQGYRVLAVEQCEGSTMLQDFRPEWSSGLYLPALSLVHNPLDETVIGLGLILFLQACTECPGEYLIECSLGRTEERLHYLVA